MAPPEFVDTLRLSRPHFTPSGVGGLMLPLYLPHLPPEVGQLAAKVLASGQIATGPAVREFEGLLSAFIGNRLLTTYADVSSALTICLFEAGVRPGDEVLMSPLVCLSTSSPVRNLFADIRWCDVDPMTGNIDAQDIAGRITRRTKAIVVYHWAGNPADLEAIQSVAAEHGIPVIEDAGEALGAEFHGNRIGANGSDYTVFSFYPNRHLTTIEGAAVAFGTERRFQKSRWLGRYGIHRPSFRTDDGEINPESDIECAGWNSYLNNVAGTIGISQMAHLPSIIATHQDNGAYYDKALAPIKGIQILKRPADSRSVYWVYTFLSNDRDALLKALRREGIYASKVHLRNDLYSCFGASASLLPGVDYFAKHTLSIPCGWWVSPDDRARVVEVIERKSA